MDTTSAIPQTPQAKRSCPLSCYSGVVGPLKGPAPVVGDPLVSRAAEEDTDISHCHSENSWAQLHPSTLLQPCLEHRVRHHSLRGPLSRKPGQGTACPRACLALSQLDKAVPQPVVGGQFYPQPEERACFSLRPSQTGADCEAGSGSWHSPREAGG